MKRKMNEYDELKREIEKDNQLLNVKYGNGETNIQLIEELKKKNQKLRQKS